MKLKNIIKNKKADEKVLGFWWILIMLFTGAAIILCVIIINGAPLDVGYMEADILASRVLDCIVSNGYLVGNFSPSFDLQGRCGFDFKEIDVSSGTAKITESKYYVEVNISELNGKFINGFYTRAGEETKKWCEYQKVQGDAKKLAKCVQKNVYSLMKTAEGDKKILIKIYTGVNKREKNAL